MNTVLKVEKGNLAPDNDQSSPHLSQADVTPWSTLIGNVASQIQRGCELDELLQRTVEDVRALLDCDRVCIYRVSPDGNHRIAAEAISEAKWSLSPRLDFAPRLEASLAKAFEEGQYLTVDDISTAQLPLEQTNFLSEFSAKAHVVIPILEKERLWGCLMAQHCQSPHRWDILDIQSAHQLSVQLGIATFQALLLGRLETAQASLAKKVAQDQQANTNPPSSPKTATSANDLEKILEVILAGYWDWDIQNNEEYLSPSFKQMFGYEDHELPNSPQTWQDLIFPEDLSKVLDSFNRHVQSRGVTPYRNEVRYRHKDGSTVWVLCSGQVIEWDEVGAPLRMIGCHFDITEEIQMRSALKNSELQLSSILNSSVDGIMAFRSIRDSQGKIVDFEWMASNPVACEIVGHPGSLVGKRLLVELPGNLEEGLFDRYVQVVNSGIPDRHQFYYQHDGIDSWFENVSVKLGDGFAVTFRDITEHKLSAKEVQDQADRKVQKINQKLEGHVETLRKHNTEMLMLGKMSDFLQACRSIPEACEIISTLVQPLFPDCSGSIYITRDSRSRLEKVVTWNSQAHTEPDFPSHDCWGLRRGRLHLITEKEAGLRCNHAHKAAPEAETLCIPMIAQGEALGLFHLHSEKKAILEGAQQLAQTVSEQIGLAIANLHLRETLQSQSVRDSLTGLFNRRYLEESLSQEIARAKRKEHEVGIIMLDIDHFKRFNDVFGHEAGDLVLKSIGSLLKRQLRASDIACRYGGEEITLVLPEASIHDTQVKADKIRVAINELVIASRGKNLGEITVSLGVSSFPKHGSNSSDLLKAADAALYQAKAAGRNQVVAAPE